MACIPPPQFLDQVGRVLSALFHINNVLSRVGIILPSQPDREESVGGEESLEKDSDDGVVGVVVHLDTCLKVVIVVISSIGSYCRHRLSITHLRIFRTRELIEIQITIMTSSASVKQSPLSSTFFLLHSSSTLSPTTESHNVELKAEINAHDLPDGAETSQ